MGGDGGSIPRRCEIVKDLKKVIHKADPDRAKSDLAQSCGLSHHPLTKPVVICDLGNLFSKTSVIEFLLEKKNASHAYRHIKSMKHVYEVNACFLDEEKANNESTRTPMICPVTNIQFIGSRKFVMMRHCRCVVSEDAINKMGTAGVKCVACEKPLWKQGEGPDDSLFPDGDEYRDVLPLLPEEAVKDKLRERLFTIREEEHRVKLQKKEAKKAVKARKREAAAKEMEVKAEQERAAAALELAGLSKEELALRRKDERKRKRREEKIATAKKVKAEAKSAGKKEDARAAHDSRFKSKVFASMFLDPGQDDATNRKEFMSGISTKALSGMSYL